MTMLRWSPGPHRAIVWDGGFALLDQSVSDQAAERIWATMRQVSQLGAFLQAVMDATGESLLTMPQFAVAILSDAGAHVAVRGQFQVSVRAEEATSLTGVGVTTWEEKLVPRAAAVVLEEGVVGSRRIPFMAGVVDAAHLSWVGENASQDTQPVADESTAQRTSCLDPLRADPATTLVPEAPAPQPRPSAEPLPARAANRASESTEETADEGKAQPGRGIYDGLWDESVALDVEDAAVRTASETQRHETPAPDAELRDGLTIADDSQVKVTPPSETVEVLAVLCERGHGNPPQRATCYTCGSPVGGQPRSVERPQLGWLKITGGESVPLRGPVVAGRNPRVIPGVVEPRLVALPHRHVSGNHIAFLLEGWTVLARDLGSSNGSYLRRHGKPPVRLPEQAVPLIAGDVIDLGHGVFINVDRIP